MIADNSFRWAAPQSWPWMIWLWVAVAVGSWIFTGFKWLRKRQSESWPVADGRIEKAEAREPETTFWKPKQNGTWEAVLEYSYTVDGEYHSGTYKYSAGTEIEAAEYVRDMQSRPVTVHVNPAKLSESVLAKQDVEELLNTKRPLTEEEQLVAEDANALPGWVGMLLWPFTLAAALGLTVSFVAHVGALLGKQILPGYFFGLLHAGIFAVFFPTVFVMQKRIGNTRRSDAWKVAMKDAPAWMRYMFFVIFTYAIVNFAIFMAVSPGGKHASHGVTSTEWRGFSGHWMVFYSASFGVLYSAAVSRRKRCINGHVLNRGSLYCTQCGGPPR